MWCGKRAVDYGFRGHHDPPKLWFPCSFFVLSLFVCQGKVDEVDTGAGALSEAKTQRRPHSARERESERGGVPLLFRCFCIFLLAGQAKTPKGTTTRTGGEKGEARRWFKRAAA